MFPTVFLIPLSFLAGLQNSHAVQSGIQFSKQFSFGVSSSAYQIEGAWNKSGKGENIWDRYLHKQPYPKNLTNADISSRGYNKMREDIELLNFLNVRHYRMSISWSRLLPKGLPTYVNPAGVDYYRTQFKLLRENQIEPFVTLYHWDLPQPLQDMGGFLNKSMVHWFKDYARIAFGLFGNDVKYWSTFNEPYHICAGGYGGSKLAPALNKSGTADYICGHNLLLAHAEVWHLYDTEFRESQQGKISMSLDAGWVEPASESEEDKLAAEVHRQFYVGWFANPIYLGDYPKVMKGRILERSNLEGRQKSRLPEFTEKEIQYIKGTHDYFSLNTYTTFVAKSAEAPLRPVRFQYDVGANISIKQGDTTPGIRKLLAWIKRRYNNPAIFITENGLGLKSTSVEDPQRITYIQNALSSINDAMKQDDVRVYGYTYWSFMDSFEWNNGYSKRFGLFAVDFNDPDRPRTPRKSAFWYRNLAMTGCTVEKCPRSDKSNDNYDY